MVWGKIGADTATSATPTLKVDVTTPNNFVSFMNHIFVSGSNNNHEISFNSDQATVYAHRSSINGGSDGTSVNTKEIGGLANNSSDKMQVGYVADFAGEEKLCIMFQFDAMPTGAGNVPTRCESYFKYVPASASRLTDIVSHDDQWFSSPTADRYATDSNLTLLGSDLTPTAGKPTNVQVGSRFEETDTRKMYYRMDSNYVTDKWFKLGTLPYAGGRGVFGGGYASTYNDTMDYITISTPSNATDFGDLTVSRIYVEAVSSITRGVFGGGHDGSNKDVMDYITFSTPSNATDFGNLTVSRHAVAGVSSGTRGVFGGGNGSNVMEYITIATPSNATDFGDLTVARQDLAGVSSDTRGVFAGGDGSNVMDYITISTPSNATDFGDLLTNLRYPADVSNGTRGVFAGGDPNSGQGNTNVIQYITIATTGNATDFGDLTVGRHAPAGVESDTRGVIGGGYSGSNSNVMDYITIATTGNATDFGDLTVARNHLAGASRF